MSHAEIASPCRQICRLDHDQICTGCGRSIAEIAQWPSADSARRLQICRNAARRIGLNTIMNSNIDGISKVDTEHRLEQFSQRISIPVRWGDMDSMGHVNNAKYFTFDESGRIAYFDELARADATFWNDHGLILAHIGADFIAQLRYPATVDIGTRVARLGRSSLHTVSAIFSGATLVAVVKGVIVWFDYLNQKPMAIPAHAREMILSRERVKPEE